MTFLNWLFEALIVDVLDWLSSKVQTWVTEYQNKKALQALVQADIDKLKNAQTQADKDAAAKDIASHI